ncbi:hypothetical protein K7A41_09470 [Sphingobacterium sp. InxBP1]|uniref:hypothetical protein n=1 Tax=Sphingobacterium sp. InxBP1 TaxID=2870328 RepID=UPI0022446A83|nr:hypothetical protein [Sphingobacterium sp. InxBP1]MCW8311451.1 hypothetical protein [Sphingobacterium sp. InxBP1]
MQLTTVRQAIQSDLPTIGNLLVIDPTVLKATISLEIESLTKFLNVGKVMDASQAASTIELIIACYPDLNLADIKLFFLNMKRGAYGKTYDRIDGNVLLENLEAYNQAKIAELENIHIERKHQGSGQFHPKVIEVMNAAIDDYRKRKAEEQKNKPIEKRQKTYEELLANRWMKQFDNLHSKFGLQRVGGRFIKIGDTIMDFGQFMNKKFENATK